MWPNNLDIDDFELAKLVEFLCSPRKKCCDLNFRPKVKR
jgi:hypothetical protein